MSASPPFALMLQEYNTDPIKALFIPDTLTSYVHIIHTGGQSVRTTLCIFKNFLLKYSWFPMFLQFLLYNKVTQPYTHTYICKHSSFSYSLLSLSFFFFLHFRAIPAAYGGFQARLLAYTTATAMLDLSSVCDLRHSSHKAGSLTH